MSAQEIIEFAGIPSAIEVVSFGGKLGARTVLVYEAEAFGKRGIVKQDAA